MEGFKKFLQEKIIGNRIACEQIELDFLQKYQSFTPEEK